MPDQAPDFLSGERFSRKAILTFESERPIVQVLLALTALAAVTGAFGILYNGLGQLALLTTPGAKPGLDSLQGLAVQVLGGLLGAFGFWSISKGRTERLRKLDTEFAFGALEFERLDGTGLKGRVVSLKGKSRLMAIFGTGEDLTSALRAAAGYRRRWATSGILVVSVGGAPPPGVVGRWLAQARRPEDWRLCCDAMDAAVGAPGIASGASWVLLGKSGRVRGAGPVENFDEVLAFIGVEDNLSLLPARAPVSGTVEGDGGASAAEVLAVHDAFYEALKEGNAAAMRPLWIDSSEVDSEETKKRRVSWDAVLTDRAAVLDVVDADVVFSGPDLGEATVTSIEVCEGNPSLFNEGGPDGKGTLLATKRFRREADGGRWRLLSHQTIPYCRNTLATQALRCNSAGCMLLKPGG